MTLLAVTDETFAAEVLRREGPVLVDFWARWCPPCHMIAPVLEQIAADRAGTLTIVKVNTDENPLVARDLQVMPLPTLILFSGGEPMRSFVGARPKVRLEAELDEALATRV
jgi:thioredoxin 1